MFLTGHTGFKGSWLTLWLERLGATVAAVSLEPDTYPSLYSNIYPHGSRYHYCADICDEESIRRFMVEFKPEIVIHMAAQALVYRSYNDPRGTFLTNVIGTVSVLEAIRATASVRTVIVVTSDKVYANDGGGAPFTESDVLGGKDPYSTSKACTELVCQSYRDAFFSDRDIRLATVRAGNVVGGGDWSKDRLVPDCLRAIESGEPIRLRSPEAIRPWQHVLEPLDGYLRFARALTERPNDGLPTALNFGPEPTSFATVSQVATAIGATHNVENVQVVGEDKRFLEATILTLNSDLANHILGWRPRLNFSQTIDWTVAWYRAHRAGADMRAFTLSQIASYEEMAP